jgi:uncharacterized protein (DUF1800 family)
MTPNVFLRRVRRSPSSSTAPAASSTAKWSSWTAQAFAVAMLAACGGGQGDGASAGLSTSTAAALTTATTAPVRALAVTRTPTAVADAPASRAEAARFLTQATFGPTAADIDRLMLLGYSAWIDEQFALPATSHRAYWEAADAALKALPTPGAAGQDQVWESFWKQAVNGPDQLRQRVVFALSEIFVISALDGNVGEQPRAMAAWLDMLGQQGFGTYRRLLENVSLHPLMGLYLTSLKNRKADAATGRVPDENYAREVMQLFSIGLVKLNRDGTPVLIDGKPVETYTPTDISGLARVFTGWSWACSSTNNNCFNNGSTGGISDPDRHFKPMQAYPQFHSTVATSFLGVNIGQQKSPDPRATLSVALDTLNKHPNTPPFISTLLIQRLVTSNPSPKYVGDVAAVFERNANGGRGDLKAVVKAILTHPEARTAVDPRGKVREPVLRLSAYLRAFPHTSITGGWKVGNTDSAATSLGQTPLRAGSVFNFFRPGYVAPGTVSAGAGLVAPELQLLNESSASGYVNFMRDNLGSGVGQFQGTVGGVVYNRRDLQRDWAPEVALALTPAELIASVTGRLLYTPPSATLLTDLTTAINSITVPTPTATNAAAVLAAKRNRINVAVLLTLASPEFLVQK